MDRKQRIEARLREAFAPADVGVEDDSARHADHAGARSGGETHYRVRVVSARFEGLSRVARHRLVFDALKGEFAGGLHALNIEAVTPEAPA
jgi:BolA protein